MLHAALEGLVGRLTSLDAGADLDAARAVFHERAGEFSDGDDCYESRIRFFLDWYLCAWSPSPARRALALDLSGAERDTALACLRATRGLFRAEEEAESQSQSILLVDELRGARFHASTAGAAARIRPGDVFDGHVLVVSDEILIAPGLLFHPAEAHEPLRDLVDRARAADDPVEEVLDGLLRIRMRLERFTSIRPRHLYRYEALADPEILSAGWARKAERSG